MTNLKNVNIMSDAKYSAATKNQDELYFTPADSYVDSRITSIMNSMNNKYNWNGAVSKSFNTVYTAEFTGLLWCFGMEGYETRSISINGTSFNWCYHYGSGYSSGEVQIPLHKGDVFYVGSSSSGGNIYFVPVS